MSLLKKAPIIGVYTGGFFGATSKGQTYTNPLTGEEFTEEISPLNRLGRIVAGSTRGLLGGLGIRYGSKIISKVNNPETINTLNTIKNKININN